MAGLVVFHAVLLAGRLADASLAHPEVIARWIGAVLLGVGALALRRQGGSLVSGRGALVFWLLVLLLHVGFGSGLTLTGAETGSGSELLLLLPIAGLAAAEALAAERKFALFSRKAAIPTVVASLRFLKLHPAPALASAGAGPDRFSPRPPPIS